MTVVLLTEVNLTWHFFDQHWQFHLSERSWKSRMQFLATVFEMSFFAMLSNFNLMTLMMVKLYTLCSNNLFSLNIQFRKCLKNYIWHSKFFLYLPKQSREHHMWVSSCLTKSWSCVSIAFLPREIEFPLLFPPLVQIIKMHIRTDVPIFH